MLECETARLDRALSNSTQKGATIFRHLEINLAARIDPKAIADLLGDRHLPFAGNRYGHVRTRVSFRYR